MRAKSVPSLLMCAALGCECGESSLVAAHGAIVVDSEIDLGEVGVGGRASKELVVGNAGLGPLRVASVDRTEGFPPEFGISPDQLVVPPSGEGRIVFSFDPVSEGPRVGKVLLRSDTPDRPSVQVTVKAIGVSTEITASPIALDFGKVVKGSFKRLTFEVVNTGLRATTASIVSLGGEAPGLFRVDPPVAEIPLEGGERAAVGVKFSPTYVGEARAVIHLRACVNCPDVPVSLRGEGIQATVVAQPNPLIFPTVPVGQEHTLSLELENLGTAGATVNMALAAQFGYPAHFTMPFVSGPFAVPPGSSSGGALQRCSYNSARWCMPIDVRFSPTTTGEHKGTIAIDVAGSARVQIEVLGYSGGPEIDQAPRALSFGPVQVGMSVTKTLSLFNLAPDDPTTLDNLVLRSIVSSSPRFEVRLPPAVAGLPTTILPGRSLLLSVTYRPTVEGADNETLTIASNDADEDPVVVPLTGAGVATAPCVWTVQPDPDPGMVFGIVPSGSTVKQNLILKNVGSNSCNVARVQFVGANGAPHDPAFDIIGHPSGVTNATLAVGGTLKYEIAFQAGLDRDHADVLRVEVDASAVQSADIKVTGTSRAGCLNVQPRNHDFGLVRPGCASNGKRFDVTNACGLSARLDQLLLSSAVFQLVSGPPPGATLAAGAQTSYTVRYVPTPCPQTGPCYSIGQDYGYATLYNSVTPPIGVALLGEAAPNAEHSDVFTQVQTPKVDVLWVVDNSGSMGEEQGAISANMGSFVTYLSGLDYRLAVTTTDVVRGGGWFGDSAGEDGRFVGSPSIITSATPNAAGAFASNVQVGVNGDGVEMGLEAAYRAIFVQQPSFARADAYLSIVVISDEEDSVFQSRTVDWYHQQFVSRKGDRTKFIFSGITGGPSGCSTAYPEARYSRMVQLTGGVWQSICTQNWSQAMQAIGHVSTGFLSRFHLSRQAEPGTVKVTVNGAPVGESQWDYEPATNSVVFTSSAPAPGATVVVTYREVC